MYTHKGELEFDEDEMAALEGQRLVAELFPDSGSELDFEGFHASEPAGNLTVESGSEAVTESDDDEGMTGRLQHTGRTLICQIRVRPHVPLIHASGFSAYEIYCSLFPKSCLTCW